MNLAIAQIESLDPYAAWHEANAVTRCTRLAAIITATDCERNRTQTYVNGCCSGCGGLDNQTALTLVWDAATALPSTVENDDQVEGLDALDEIIDGLYEDPEPSDSFDDVELDLDDEELLNLFPELADEKDKPLETAMRRFFEYQEEAPRRAAYRGSCERCGGFVQDIREWHNDTAFRCLLCGWRTGAEYERNRQIQARGGVIL